MVFSQPDWKAKRTAYGSELHAWVSIYVREQAVSSGVLQRVLNYRGYVERRGKTKQAVLVYGDCFQTFVARVNLNVVRLRGETVPEAFLLANLHHKRAHDNSH